MATKRDMKRLETMARKVLGKGASPEAVRELAAKVAESIARKGWRRP